MLIYYIQASTSVHKRTQMYIRFVSLNYQTIRTAAIPSFKLRRAVLTSLFGILLPEVVQIRIISANVDFLNRFNILSLLSPICRVAIVKLGIFLRNC
jgi:hypothetical protein